MGFPREKQTTQTYTNVLWQLVRLISDYAGYS